MATMRPTIVAGDSTAQFYSDSLMRRVAMETVNGSIRAAMSTLGQEELHYRTVNGSITLELPADVNAALELETVTGSVSTDFPVTVLGRMSRRALRGTVGSGGRRIKASTVNGSIELKRPG